MKYYAIQSCPAEVDDQAEVTESLLPVIKVLARSIAEEFLALREESLREESAAEDIPPSPHKRSKRKGRTAAIRSQKSQTGGKRDHEAAAKGRTVR